MIEYFEENSHKFGKLEERFPKIQHHHQYIKPGGALEGSLGVGEPPRLSNPKPV